ncbi:MAG: hypothetical protein UHY90_03360 [Treponema sp.]|nr:hypothetical protein [Spirochaetia bacterium]MDD7458984.1 hypothetical protein [Spirochaetales bacterium]MDY5764674.1 hypothetical protein [Treponema sp.]MDD7611509.1 hypothetical protein [Spirochaetales bacterium]MDY5812468.1 hypothetical protein [Treponema sp.]
MKNNSNKRDWYECSNCKNQGYVFPSARPDPSKWGGCSCEGAKFSGNHNWQKLEDFQNIETDLLKFPNQYFNIQ